MKFKTLKYLVGLSLSITLSGCSLLPNMNLNSNRANSSDEGEPISFFNDNSSAPDYSSFTPTSAANNGVGDGIEPYQGNPNRTIGKIENRPVSEYQPETLEKIRSFAELIHGGSVGQDMVDAFADCMLAFNIGDELACATCDFIFEAYNISYGILDSENYTETLVNYYYDALKLINSADFGAAANFFTVLNSTYKEMCTKGSSYYNVDSLTMLDIYSPDFGYSYLTYHEYLDIKNHLNEYGNSDLNEIIAAYDNAYSNFHFSENQIRNFNSIIEERREEAENMIVVPDYFISFLRKHASQSKDMLINKLKLIVDATSEFAPLVLDLTTKVSGRTYYGSNYLYAYTENGYGTTLYNSISDDGQSEYREYTIRDYAAKFLEKRQIILGLAKSILTDEQFGDLLIDSASELLIPMLRDIYPETESNSAILSRLSVKLNSLNGKHIRALANFLLKLINEVYDDDIINILVAVYGEGEGDYSIFDFGDKYIDKLTETVAALTASDKSLITELIQVLGFDLFAKISEFTNIYKGKDLSTEAGQETFYEAISTFWEGIYEQIYDTVGLSYNNKNTASVDYEDYYSTFPHVSLSFYGSVTVGMTQEEILNNVYIYYEDYITIQEGGETYQTTISYSDRYAYWNQNCQNAAEEYNNAINNPDDYGYYSDYDLQRLLLRSQLVASELECSTIDTSSCGYGDVEISVKINGVKYTNSSTILVRPASGLPTINKIYNKGYTSGAYRCNGGSAVGPDIFNLNDTFTIYDSLVGDNVEITANKLGWNMYINKATTNPDYYYYDNYDYSCYVYYVVDPNVVSNYITEDYTEVGYFFEGDDDFYEDPYHYVYYEYNGLRFYKSSRLPFSDSYVNGKSVNRKYTVTYQGDQFSYIIIGQNTGEKYHYEFELREYISGEIRQPVTMSARVYVYYLYQFAIDNHEYRISRGVSDYEASLIDFTYYNDVISFKYDGQTFTFNAERLAELLARND